jgi:two-component system response regulator AtoC
MAEILVVDDDQSIATAFERFLRQEGHVCTVVSNAEDAIRVAGEREPDLVLMDIRMPGVSGLEALQQLRARHPHLYVVIMTAYGTSQTSIDAIRAGAFEYLTKPLDLDQLRSVIRHALSAKRGRDEADADVTTGTPPQHKVRLVGEVPALQEVYKMIGRLAVIDVPALVVGEHGTGKELVVSAIHDNSSRHDRSFVTVDCESLTEAQFEEDLRAAEGGTLHLAGVHALSRTVQTQIVRIADERNRPTSRTAPNVRIIASTDHDLGTLVETGGFSRELFDRLAVITLRLPALRARREDIPLLVRYFLERFNEELNRSIRGVDDEVLRRFEEHSWPGNVGELERVLKRACIITRGDIITMQDVGERLTESRVPRRQDAESALSRAAGVALQERLVEGSGPNDSPFHDIVGLVEATLVREALSITNGNQVKAAELLRVNRATLRKKASGD